MPYEGEFATGESLLSLERSEALREFQGSVRKREEADAPNPAVLTVPRNSWMPNVRPQEKNGSRWKHFPDPLRQTSMKLPAFCSGSALDARQKVVMFGH